MNGDRGRGRDRDRDGDRDHRRRQYFRGYGLAFSYGYGYPGVWPGYPFLWNLSSCILGCDASDYGSYDNPSGYGAGYGDNAGSVAPAPYGQYGDAMMQYPGYPAAPAYSGEGQADYQPPADDAPAARSAYSGEVVSTPPPPQPPLKVIMKSGQQLQVHNYMLTSTTLTVLDDKYRQIPLDEIDVPATRQSNLADGLDFRIPHAPREATPGQVKPGAGAGGTTTPSNQRT
jgi:hypothetical protein